MSIEVVAKKIHLTSQTLHQFIIGLQLDEIQTMDALLVQMMQDHAAARMIARILYWRDKAVKFGGWVWKSWRDWRAECGLSQGQIKRVHREGVLEDYGMARSLMKANGAPTTHYLLDEDAFIRKLADFLGLAFDEIRQRLSIIAEGGKAPTKATNKKTLTKEDTHREDANGFDKAEDFMPDLPAFQPQSICNIIAEATDLSPEQLAQFDEDKLKDTWLDFLPKLRPSFLDAYAKSMNDLFLHAFMGVPAEQVVVEMERRSKGYSTREEPHRDYQIYLEQVLKQPE